MDATHLPVTPRQFNRTMKHNGSEVLILSLLCPEFPQSGPTRRAERYFSHMVQQWQNRWETLLYPKACQAHSDCVKKQEPFEPWQAALHYKITLWHPPIISLQIDIQEQTSAFPRHVRIGEVWNMKTGYPCSLRQFLAVKPRRWKKEVIGSLCSQAQQRIDSGESLLRPDCIPDLKQAFDPDRFYLTETGVELYYPMYILGPFAEGIPTFTLPVLQ